jgi:hypothetical protein
VFHGFTLEEVGDYIGENTGADKNTGGGVVDSAGALSGLQADATQLWIDRAGHSCSLIVYHPGNQYHCQSK